LKFRGPCIDCGKSKNQQYILKRCIACYQKFHRYDKEFEPRQKYKGPCIRCGMHESPNGRFTRKMCSVCYNKFRTGSNGPKITYKGPCVSCGSSDSRTGKFVRKMCANCYRVYSYNQSHPKQQGYCIDCGVNIETKRKITKCKRCLSCYRKWKRKTDPAYLERERKKLKAYASTERGKETARGCVRRRRARQAQVEHPLTSQEWQVVLKKYDYKCVYCGSKKRIEMDHIVPLSKGGKHSIQNVLPACRSCNAEKNNKLPLKPIQPLLL